MAVISLDFSSTTTCPSDRVFSRAQAEAMWTAALPSCRLVVGAPQGLAVDGDQPALGDLLDGLHPAQQGLLEGRRIESGEHASGGILTGDIVGQVEGAGQPTPTVDAEFVDRGEGVGAGEHAADG